MHPSCLPSHPSAPKPPSLYSRASVSPGLLPPHLYEAPPGGGQAPHPSLHNSPHPPARVSLPLQAPPALSARASPLGLLEHLALTESQGAPVSLPSWTRGRWPPAPPPHAGLPESSGRHNLSPVSTFSLQKLRASAPDPPRAAPLSVNRHMLSTHYMPGPAVSVLNKTDSSPASGEGSRQLDKTNW